MKRYWLGLLVVFCLAVGLVWPCALAEEAMEDQVEFTCSPLTTYGGALWKRAICNEG